jgi:myo-inositol-1(or 4)-monophosphatase
LARTVAARPYRHWTKGTDHSPVSEADIAVNDLLRERLTKLVPDAGWVSEETETDQAARMARMAWIVDPIDGTRAFIAGKEIWCVSAAVVHRGRPVAGVLFAPSLDELFTAAAEGPALKNGRPVSASEPDAGRPIRIAAAEDMAHGLEPNMAGGVQRISHVPSLAYRLAMVADGRIDATLVKRNSHDWDLAAADLILSRAGGGLVTLDGAPLSYNRPTVSHETLCAAGSARLSGLVEAARHLSGH